MILAVRPASQDVLERVSARPNFKCWEPCRRLDGEFGMISSTHRAASHLLSRMIDMQFCGTVRTNKLYLTAHRGACAAKASQALRR
jgi:hypothetical protein